MARAARTERIRLAAAAPVQGLALYTRNMDNFKGLEGALAVVEI
ncbi:PIN domain-containing protein [Nocardiopsis xinjiangensis]|nr:type II toxin-antitoxin system VapC family toxin [Nocardiopsis xinjiangensis]